MAVHLTSHFTAGDIDAYNESPIGRPQRVYTSKKRFPSPEVNKHLGQTVQLVGASCGDTELDNMRFRTTNRDQFSMEKIKFGKAANPETIYEKMALQSRKLPNHTFGKPRSILAHEDRGRNASCLVQHNSTLPNLIKDSGAKPATRERHSMSTMTKALDFT